MPAPRKVSNTQKEVLIGWMESHPVQANPTQQTGCYQKVKLISLWEPLATTLNAVGDGFTRSPKEWRLYWNDLKSKIKKRSSLIQQQLDGQGNGQSFVDFLSPIEQRVINIMGAQNVSGNETVQSDVDLSLDHSLPPPQPSPTPSPPVVVKLSSPTWLAESSGSPVSVYEFTTAGPSQAPSAGPSFARPLKRRHSSASTNADDPNHAERYRTHTLDSEESREVDVRRRLEERRVAIEERRLALEERQLAMEERRVAIKERRLAMEGRRLAMEERRLAMEEQQLATEERQMSEEQWVSEVRRLSED